jgi:hypothetical protein
VRLAVGRSALVLLVVMTVVSLLTVPAEAQGDGPHSLPLLPVGMNFFVALPLGLSGNFNPSQTVLIPGANVDVFAVPLTYIRTFSLGGRFGRVFVTAPLATLDASGDIAAPGSGTLNVSRGRSGWMDPMVTLHLGLVGAPALKGPEFVKHPKSFQMVAIAGAGIPIGTYDPDRLINLGTNRWSFRLGVGTVMPLAKATAWEAANSVFLFTDNKDVFGPAGMRSQDPLIVSENHFTHSFSPKWWGSVDLRYQYGGETATDGVPDDNLANILGGGLTLGHQFTPHFGGYASYGRVLAKKGDAQEWMVRCQLACSF